MTALAVVNMLSLICRLGISWYDIPFQVESPPPGLCQVMCSNARWLLALVPTFASARSPWALACAPKVTAAVAVDWGD
jgi:hypothetical protein